MLEPRRIIEEAARIFDIPVPNIVGYSRFIEHTHARLVTYLVLRKTGMSDAAIGRRMNRDRTTITHGCKQAENLISRYPYLREAFEQLEKFQ